MKKHRAAFLLFFSLIASLAVLAQEAGTLHLRPLHLEFPSTWRFNGSKNPIEGSGPDGERALATIMRGKSGTASEPTLSTAELAKGFAQGPMAQLATEGDKVLVRPVTELTAPDGRIAYSAVSQRSGLLGGKSYFFQYLMAGPGTVIYITFEGKGEAAGAMQKFDGIIATQRWDDPGK